MESFPNPKNLSHKIDARLSILGTNRTEISELWGCTIQQFSYWMNSDLRDPRDETMDMLGFILGMSPKDLNTSSWDGVFNPMPEWFVQARKHGEIPKSERPYKKYKYNVRYKKSDVSTLAPNHT